MLRSVSVSLLILTLLGLAPLAMGQTSTTSVRGTVTDPNGAVVPGAAVTLTSPATGVTRNGVTNAQGVYQFLQLPPGTYNITASARGFADAQAQNVRLLVNSPGTINLSLPVAQAKTTVEVTSETPLVNTQDASLGNAFNTIQIENLPFEGRDPVGILSLQPGVTFVGNNVDQSYDSRGGSVNGARSDQTNVTLDGVDDNDPNAGFAFQGALRSTLDSLQEFRVTTSNANAEAGRSSGAQVALVTKSGTNAVHGSVYEVNRNTATSANDWFNKQAQLRSGLPNRPGQLIRNTFGADLGGPLIKNRLFFFLNYEGQRTRESTQVTRTVPSAELRQGIMRYVDANGNVQTLTPAQFASMDPACTAAGTCPLGPGANPAVLQVLNTYPLPNTTTGAGDGLDFQGFTFAAATPSKLDTYIAKLDFNASNAHRLFLRGNLQNDHFTAADAGSAPQFPGQPSSQVNRNNNKGVAAGWTWTLSNTLLNNLRYGYTRIGLGFAGLQTAPHVIFRGLDDPTAFTPTRTIIVPVHNIVDDVSWTKGAHTFQFGGNWRHINNDRNSNERSFFDAITNPSWLDNASIANSGSSLDPAAFGFPAVSSDFSQSYDLAAATLAGLVTEVDASYNRTKTGAVLPQGSPVRRRYRSNEFETYLQDAWRIKPNLTVTIGARYTLLQPPYEITGTEVAPSMSLADFFQQRARAMLSGQTYHPLVSFDLTGQANHRAPIWNWDYHDIAPRVAFAWAPEFGSEGLLHRLVGGAGKTSIRLGYGMFYDHFGEGIVNSFDRNGSFGLTTLLSNPAGTVGVDSTPRFTSLNAIPAATTVPPPTGGFPSTPPSTLATGGFAITWGLDNKLKTPYSHVFDFSFTRELPANFAFEASYVGRLGRRLLQEDDLAMPLDIRDPASGMDYFQAMTMLAVMAENKVPIQSVGPIPYWEHMFPGAAGAFGTVGSGCAVGTTAPFTPPATLTATQAIYDQESCGGVLHNETTGLSFMDASDTPNGCFPACSVLGPYAYFDPQWSSLYAWRSMGTSSYNAGQFSLRRRAGSLQFDFNYTYSKSIDLGSNAERINTFEGFGFASQIINAWAPKQLRAVSDFDTTHQFNANWVWQIPVGQGRTFASGVSGWLNNIIGGWQLTGIWRWTSGYPFTVEPGLGFWPTNWELTSATFLNGKAPKTGKFIDSAGDPNVFQNATAAVKDFRFAHPGESGQRNELRGPGYFGVDAGLGKTFKLTERQSLAFAWETFNVSNTPRFDVGSLQFIGNNSITSVSSFGKFTKTLTTPRVMQFSLRYNF